VEGDNSKRVIRDISGGANGELPRQFAELAHPALFCCCFRFRRRRQKSERRWWSY